jgi:hypothetical protein
VEIKPNRTDANQRDQDDDCDADEQIAKKPQHFHTVEYPNAGPAEQESKTHNDFFAACGASRLDYVTACNHEC